MKHWEIFDEFNQLNYFIKNHLNFLIDLNLVDSLTSYASINLSLQI